MKEEILSVFECFVVENWGRLVLEETFSSVGLDPEASRMGERVRQLMAELNLPRMFGTLAVSQQLDLKDVVFAFGKFCFPHFAARMPRTERSQEHPKHFLMAMHELLSFDSEQSGFVQFEFVDCGPEELLMIYRSRQSFSSFLEGFVAGVAESFSHQIECRPVIAAESPSVGGQFHLTFKGEI